MAALAAAALTGPSLSRAYVIYDNLTPNNAMAAASRPATGGTFEIASADDFLIGGTGSMRIDGTEIVGRATPPSFNAAFSLSGEAVAAAPEPGSLALAGAGLLAVWWYQRNRKR
jgi:hypothetical protein